jgi:hypothetical protein
MSSSEDGKKDYEVGYGKPPKHTRWPKGQSGNPKGKKTKAESVIDKVKKVASEELIVHKGGAAQAMSYLDAAIYAIFAKAQSGHPQAFKLVAELLGKDGAEAVAASSYTMTDADLSVLQTAADWAALVEKAEAEKAANAPHDHYIDEGDDDHDDLSEPH